MTTFRFHTTVLDDGMLAVPLPEEFRGKTVDVLTDDEEKLLRIVQADYNFRHPKPLEELLKDVKPTQDIADLCPQKPIWDSEEEFCEFLEFIGQDVENYRSIEYLSKKPLE
jgi:hypothetical protein